MPHFILARPILPLAPAPQQPTNVDDVVVHTERLLPAGGRLAGHFGRGTDGRGIGGDAAAGRGSGRGSVNPGRGAAGRGDPGRGAAGRGDHSLGAAGRGAAGRGAAGRGRGDPGRGAAGRGRGDPGRGAAGLGATGRGNPGRADADGAAGPSNTGDNAVAPPANLPPPPTGQRRRRLTAEQRRQARSQQITVAHLAAGDEEVQHIDEAVASSMRSRKRQVDNVDVLDTISDSIVSVTDRLTSVLERASIGRVQSTQPRVSLTDEIDRLYKRRKQAEDANMDASVLRWEQQINRLENLEHERLISQFN